MSLCRRPLMADKCTTQDAELKLHASAPKYVKRCHVGVFQGAVIYASEVLWDDDLAQAIAPSVRVDVGDFT